MVEEEEEEEEEAEVEAEEEEEEEEEVVVEEEEEEVVEAEAAVGRWPTAMRDIHHPRYVKKNPIPISCWKTSKIRPPKQLDSFRTAFSLLLDTASGALPARRCLLPSTATALITCRNSRLLRVCTRPVSCGGSGAVAALQHQAQQRPCRRRRR
jgi:hypothetical protein